MAGDTLGTSTLPESLTFPAVGFGILGLIVIETGRTRRARYPRAQETVYLRLGMTESSRRLFVLSAVSTFAGAGVVRFLVGETGGVPPLIGVVGGTLIGLFVVDTRDVDLFVLDRGLIVVPNRRFGVSILPWRRIRGVRLQAGPFVSSGDSRGRHATSVPSPQTSKLNRFVTRSDDNVAFVLVRLVAPTKRARVETSTTLSGRADDYPS
jgi:hypothetical protein